MSFILDALKKSESDRQKQDTPGFSHVPDKAGDKAASHWIWIVVVLIVINIAVLTVMFMRPDSNGAPDPSSAQATGNTSIDQPPAQTASDAPATAAVPADPVNAAVTQTVNRPAPPLPEPAVAAAVSAQQGIPASSKAVASPPPPANSNGSFNVEESYATFNDLRAQGLINVPDLHLDIHVFSEQASERFVFVNMSKYKESESLDEGPLVSAITPDGVILVHRGMTFLLPRE